MSRPFVIAVASEKGGVGKTTIATNLAVYLKAFQEDLPVTIASFDNHFSVDQMFALGPQPEHSIADLLEARPIDELAVLGQYGVQYIASSRRLQAPGHAPAWLHQRLLSTTLDGILILDTRPILDWFTEAALLAADLVLVPIKDRAALINASSLRHILAEAGRAERLWLVPSLVDPRARLNTEVRVHEFLTYAARERDYQVMDIFISKSPKVESLASGFSSRIRPILTHARNTAVHGQFKALAESVLQHFASGAEGRADGSPRHERVVWNEMSPVQRRRLTLECPLCCRQSLHVAGHFYFALGSRRRGFLHPGCFEQLFFELGLEAESRDELLVLTVDGPGLVGPVCRLMAHACSAEGQLTGSEEVPLAERPELSGVLSMMIGRPLDVVYRELVLVDHQVWSAEAYLADDRYKGFALRRRRVVRELRCAGLF